MGFFAARRRDSVELSPNVLARWNDSADIDSTLKILILGFALVMVFQSADRLQKIAAVVNLAWLLSYIAILFGTLRT